MNSVFLSHSFASEDKQLAADIEQLINTYGLQVIRGKKLAGAQVDDAVKNRINQADSFVAVYSEKASATGWVAREMTIVSMLPKPAVMLLEEGINKPPGTEGYHHIPFERSNLWPAMLELANTISQWISDYGRLVQVRLLPEQLGIQVGLNNNAYRCRYRLIQQDGSAAYEWKDLNPVPNVGATFLWVNMRENHLLQVEVSKGAERWVSVARPVCIDVECKELQ